MAHEMGGGLFKIAALPSASAPLRSVLRKYSLVALKRGAETTQFVVPCQS